MNGGGKPHPLSTVEGPVFPEGILNTEARSSVELAEGTAPTQKLKTS